MIGGMTGFSSYRQLCDGLNTAFLKLGIRDEELYEAAIRDPRTVLAGDQLIPVLCPIDYVTGYDGGRIRALSSRDDVFLLSAPPSFLPDVIYNIPQEFSVLVESDSRDTAGYREQLVKLFPRSVVRDFEDPRAQNSTAALIAYTATVHPRERAGAEETAGTEDTAILSAARLRGDPRLADEIWALCGSRLDWLGEYHPVVMEESREVFFRALYHDDTRIAVKFDQGRPACVGLFMEGLGQCDWLDPKFCERLESRAAAEAARMLYFYVIASRAPGGEGHAKDVMAALEKMIWQDGKVCHFLFEATNLSSLYIPRIAVRRAGASSYVELAPGETVRPIEKVDYWYFDVGGA